MNGGVTIVYAFDPVEELENRSGLLPVPTEQAERLVAEHRVERVSEHTNSSMRYVAGTNANEAARDALRAARGEAAPAAVQLSKPRKTRH